MEVLLRNKLTGGLAYLKHSRVLKGEFGDPFKIAKAMGVKIYADSKSKVSWVTGLSYNIPDGASSWDDTVKYVVNSLMTQYRGEYQVKVLTRIYSDEHNYYGYTDEVPWDSYYERGIDSWDSPLFILYNSADQLNVIWTLLEADAREAACYKCTYLSTPLKTDMVIVPHSRLDEAIEALGLRDYEPVNSNAFCSKEFIRAVGRGN